METHRVPHMLQSNSPDDTLGSKFELQQAPAVLQLIAVNVKE